MSAEAAVTALTTTCSGVASLTPASGTKAAPKTALTSIRPPRDSEEVAQAQRRAEGHPGLVIALIDALIEDEESTAVPINPAAMSGRTLTRSG